MLETKARPNLTTSFSRLLDQLGTITLAVVLALIVWLIAINEEDPLKQGEFTEPIPLMVQGLSGTLLPLEDLSRESVVATIRAPQSEWDDLSAENFAAIVDLTDLKAGRHVVPVDLTIIDTSRIDLLDWSRREIRIELDTLITNTVPVNVEIMDTPAFGYEWQTPIIKPLTVTVRGPATQVQKVTLVDAPVFLRNAKSQVERLQALTPQDANKQFVGSVSAEPPTAQIVVPVRRFPDRKEVVVRPKLVGKPDNGYRLSAVTVAPSTVVLSGENDILNQVPGFVETESLSLEGVTGTQQKLLSLVLPIGATSVEGNRVTVTASVTPIEGGSTVEVAPLVQNLEEGFQATIALKTVDVILSGPLAQLDVLSEDDVRVILDLSGLLAGSHVVRPLVQLPAGISQEGVLPETVEVVIVPQETESADDSSSVQEK